MQGISNAQTFDLVDVYDPRLVPTYGIPGTLFRYIPAGAYPVLLIKQDSGISTNWTDVTEEGRAQARATSVNTTLDPNEDNTLYVHTLVGAVTVTLPPGQNGLEFKIKDADNNAAVNNITIAPNGTDTVETPVLTVNSESVWIQYFDGRWYTLASA